MNRNAEYPFGSTPGIKIPRSKISRPFDCKTTFNAGKLVPFYCKQVLPGQTSEIDISSFIRMMPSVTPTMDNLIADVYFFFVPNRFLWDSWEKFLGANPDGSWAQTITLVPPKIFAISNVNANFGVGDLASYLGLYPVNIRVPYSSSSYNAKDYAPMALPIRAYCKVWNDWFRSENLEKEIPYPKTSTDHTITSGSASGNFYTDILLGRGLAPVAKTADIFTRSLPAPQKGASVHIPVSDVFYGTFGISALDGDDDPDTPFLETKISADLSSSGYRNLRAYTSQAYELYNGSALSRLPIDSLGTINDLRNAFAIQRMLERDARGGTRMVELLKSHFAVSNGDLRLGRSEYLGGKRIPINMSQVVQTGGSANPSTPTPQGSVTGISVTGDKSSLFTKSFTEHGWLIGVTCVRIAHHTYSQGVDRQFFANTRYDFYWPEMANVGEFAVYKKELYAGSSTQTNMNNDVFGYQEAWYQYRYSKNLATGYFATQASNSLKVWHYGDEYSSAPTLTAEWLHEGTTEIDRSLAVTSSTNHQFLAEFFVNEKVVLPMPLYSIPGLVDHI